PNSNNTHTNNNKTNNTHNTTSNNNYNNNTNTSKLLHEQSFSMSKEGPLYARAVSCLVPVLWLSLGALVGAAASLTPVVLRACLRLLGWSQEPLLPAAKSVGRRLLFEVPFGAFVSLLCHLCSLRSGHGFWEKVLFGAAGNLLVFNILASYSFWCLKMPSQKQVQEEVKDASIKQAFQTKQTFHTITVDGRDVQLRVFVPDPVAKYPGLDNDNVSNAAKLTGKTPGSKPAVVMVCGLLWLGEGLLGLIGVTFNDAFGRAFARHGVPCVQIHTPQRHLKHTTLMDIHLLLLLPMCLVPGLRFLVLAADVAMLMTSRADVWLFVVFVLLPGLIDVAASCLLAVPMLILGPV
ncbi:unnamed protein product, partial [Polarella glacialis]